MALSLSHAPALDQDRRMKPYFDHEKLNVYQVSLGFNEWVGNFLPSITAKAAAKDQLDRAATSISLNIAEGNGKFSKRDRARFFDIARGSALESAAGLDVLVSRKLATVELVTPAKEQLVQIVNMLMGLLKTLGYAFDTFAGRVREECDAGVAEQEQEQEKD
jgi:four helix bundle protein